MSQRKRRRKEKKSAKNKHRRQSAIISEISYCGGSFHPLQCMHIPSSLLAARVWISVQTLCHGWSDLQSASVSRKWWPTSAMHAICVCVRDILPSLCCRWPWDLFSWRRRKRGAAGRVAGKRCRETRGEKVVSLGACKCRLCEVIHMTSHVCPTSEPVAAMPLD